MFNNLFGNNQQNPKNQGGLIPISGYQTTPYQQFNPTIFSPIPQQPSVPLPGVGNGSGLGFRPPNIPNGSQIGQSGSGQQQFDNVPNPFVQNSNPFYNPDQQLNNDPYGAVLGASNNFGFLPMPPNFEPLQLGAIPTSNPYITQRNQPTANRGNYQQVQIPMQQPTTIPIKQPPVQMPQIDFLGGAGNNLRMFLLQQLLANPGNFNSPQLF